MVIPKIPDVMHSFPFPLYVKCLCQPDVGASPGGWVQAFILHPQCAADNCRGKL